MLTSGPQHYNYKNNVERLKEKVIQKKKIESLSTHPGVDRKTSEVS